MNYSGIKFCDMMNGEGLRTVLFVSGCSHHCKGCHNPQTHDPCSGNTFTISTMQTIMDNLRETWCAGLTLSGGDPLYQDNRDEVLYIVKTVKGAFGDAKNIWLYTGYTWNELQSQIRDGDVTLAQILRHVDVLIDGRFIMERKKPGLRWRGSDNQCLLRLKNGKVVSEVGKWEDCKDCVEYNCDSDNFSFRHWEMRVDDIEFLRLYNKSVRMSIQPDNRLKLTARFFDSEEVVDFYHTLEQGKSFHIVITQFAADCSWRYDVVDDIFVCTSASMEETHDSEIPRNELVLEFVQDIK